MADVSIHAGQAMKQWMQMFQSTPASIEAGDCPRAAT